QLRRFEPGAVTLACASGEESVRFQEIAMKVWSLRIPAVAAVFLLCGNSAFTKEVRHLKLTEAVRLAVEQNRTLKIARFKVKENEERKAEARSDYFPTITNQSNALHISELQDITIPAGSLGTVGGSTIPLQSIVVRQGKNTLVSSGTMISQPLTQLLR